MANDVFCNICNCNQFHDYNGRTKVVCTNCGSFERHRLLKHTLQVNGLLGSSGDFYMRRALHLAPEKMTHSYMSSIYGGGYYCSDPFPEKYPYASCLKLMLPDDFRLFTDSYFDLIIHNHVLEHIPGSYKSHLAEFSRILKPGGYMVFTLPGVRHDVDTIEGGENLESDELRLRIHGQEDHYKSFGKDLFDFLYTLGGDFSTLDLSSHDRSLINGGVDEVYIFKRK